MNNIEYERLTKLKAYEKKLVENGIRYIGGIDEVGRGPLAGPVVACCIIMPYESYIEGVNDSKKLTARKRETLFELILNECISYGIGIVDEKVIDSVNILNATRFSMKKAVQNLKVCPEHLLIDAERLDSLDIPQTSIIKGDCLSYNIACASIVAKVIRDRIMTGYSNIYKHYGFEKNKGYGTREHIEAIKYYGLCDIHRLSFCKKFVGELNE
ncbi:ribonuclease HII [Calorimonas adulescens]|uniref:Ribonuclease HII n=1 Tax=Calorimonas adulescens TaxID=2606906 RepID=A0A5D8QFP7_9THEO|nr:ribonuclease HII [Calorimonas adulescens]TZE83365.1 ribonuclease HII [Calorimonas adulescens]